MTQIDDASDTEPDEGAAPAGAGLLGHGDPLTVGRGLQLRAIRDGAGLCSPGRWAPQQRRVVDEPKIVELRLLLREAIAELLQRKGLTARAMIDLVTARDHADSPFPACWERALLESALDIFGPGARARADDRYCPVRLRLLHAVLTCAGDPDAAVVLDYIAGVSIGVDQRMPRTPAVYGPKRRWSLPEQRARKDAYLDDVVPLEWRENYRSAVVHADEIERQLELLTAEGKFIRLTEDEARARWPSSTPASLGALEKTKDDGTVAVRILYDGSQGVDINARIRQRDQESGPCAPDLKRVMRAQAELGTAVPRTLTVDIEDAHRIVNVKPSDWQYQLCRARPGGLVYASTVGLFGIASISYLWGRLAGAALRGLHYVAARREELWVLLVADDFKADSTSADGDSALLFFAAYLTLMGFPIKWAKSGGGDAVDWVGYSVLVAEFKLGLSANRADWVCRWCRQLADQGSCQIGDLRDGLGRLAFAVGALAYDRPFLAPIYGYVSRHPPQAFRKLPVFVRLLLSFIAERVARRRHYCCGVSRPRDDRCPRADARADDTTIGLGGWLPTLDAEGHVSTKLSPWYSLVLDRSTAPWAYARGGKPNRSIAALEALATLYTIKLFTPHFKKGTRGAVALKGFTDNQGNAYALSKLVSGRFPLCLIVMELAVVLEEADLQLELAWTPREFNQEADDLSNGLTEAFDPARRVDIDAADAGWHILGEWMDLGLRFFEENARAQPLPRRPARRRREERLRHRDPW